MSTREKGAESSLHDWRDLAEQATKETDPEILIQIVEEVCGALELRDAQQTAQRQEKPAIKKADKGDFSVDGGLAESDVTVITYPDAKPIGTGGPVTNAPQ